MSDLAAIRAWDGAPTARIFAMIIGTLRDQGHGRDSIGLLMIYQCLSRHEVKAGLVAAPDHCFSLPCLS